MNEACSADEALLEHASVKLQYTENKLIELCRVRYAEPFSQLLSVTFVSMIFNEDLRYILPSL